MVAAEGSLSEVVELAETLLANSAKFRDRVGAADASEAAEHVYFDQIFDDVQLWTKRPFALVKITQRGANYVSDGVAVGLAAGGNVLIAFEDNARFPENHNQSYKDFLNFAGKTIDEMEQVSGSGSYLPFFNVDMVLAPQRTLRAERTDEHDYWVCAFVLQWGDLEE